MRYAIHRCAASLLVIFGAVTLVFAVLYWLPGDPAALMAGDDVSPAQVAEMRAKLGTDRPLVEQYAHYLARLAHGDLGTSFETGEPVIARLEAQFPPTLAMVGLAALISVVAGIGLGVTAAVEQDGWIDHAIQSGAMTLTSMPSFWLGILLMLTFSVHLHWLPSIGNGSFAQLILPSTCLGLQTSGHLARVVRNAVIDVLGEPYVTTLRGKGLQDHAVLYGHVLRNALIPALTTFSVLMGELLSGGVVVETLFARQGLGRLISGAIGIKDIPVIQGVVLVAAITFILINLLVDLSYGLIDPRVRQ